MPPKHDENINALIAEITAGCDDDAAAMVAFHAAIEAKLKLPTFGLALGERVQIDAVEYASPRRGIVARLRKDGRTQRISLLDVVFASKSKGAMLVAAYHRWAGAEPKPAEAKPVVTAESDIVEAVVLKVGDQTARIRPLGADEELTLRGSGSDMWKIVPGQIVRLRTKRRWDYRQYRYVTGSIESARIDITALGLTPLKLRESGPWNPDDGEGYNDELTELWEKVNHITTAYEMEQILPGAEERGWDDDPIVEASELNQVGNYAAAEKLLMDLLHVDLRCLDAHAHLGNFVFNGSGLSDTKRALAHYEVGVGIAELSLGPSFEGSLPWGMIDNRPFHRCLHGYGLALWRLERRDEALAVFERICLLNPMDNTGARFCWQAIRQGFAWKDWDK